LSGKKPIVAVLVFLRKDQFKLYKMFLNEDQAAEFWKIYNTQMKGK